jgi:hypothetical protein
MQIKIDPNFSLLNKEYSIKKRISYKFYLLFYVYRCTKKKQEKYISIISSSSCIIMIGQNLQNSKQNKLYNWTNACFSWSIYIWKTKKDKYSFKQEFIDRFQPWPIDKWSERKVNRVNNSLEWWILCYSLWDLLLSYSLKQWFYSKTPFLYGLLLGTLIIGLVLAIVLSLWLIPDNKSTTTTPFVQG